MVELTLVPASSIPVATKMLAVRTGEAGAVAVAVAVTVEPPSATALPSAAVDKVSMTARSDRRDRTYHRSIFDPPPLHVPYPYPRHSRPTHRYNH